MKITMFLLIIVFMHFKSNAQLEKVWETGTDFMYPESVVYDKERDVLYVSNYLRDVENGTFYGDAFISKVKTTGEIVKFKWIENLTSPTGLAIAFDKLYIVERFGIIEYSLKEDSILNKWLIKNAEFLNDIVVDKDSSIYISDSESNKIFRINNDEVEIWIENDSISKTNGIQIKNNKLIVGVNSDNYLKSVDLKTKEINTIAFLDEGVIDGIKLFDNDYLVSRFYGDLNLVKENGEIVELLNTRKDNIQCADFEFIEEDSIIIVPALINGKLIGYKLK